MSNYEIVHADVRQWSDHYTGNPFHAVLCDAPYEMSFMNSDWDDSGVSFDPDTWRGIARHLLPGAFLFVFAGTINDDLISVAMRKAGLRKHHKAVLYHAQGQGFPKSTRICSQIDRAAGADREVVHYDRYRDGYDRAQQADGKSIFDGRNGNLTTAPATPLARTWAGHRYGLQAIKPAVESILIFQKPYAGKSVDSIVETGAGALWIEGGRITTDDSLMGGQYCDTERQAGNCYGKHHNLPPDAFRQPSGRWPANLLLAHIAPSTCPTCDGDGCDACDGEGLVGGCRRVGEKKVASNERKRKGIVGRPKFDGKYNAGRRYDNAIDQVNPKANSKETVADWQCVDGCAVRALGEQSGKLKSGERTRNESGPAAFGNHGIYGVGKGKPDDAHWDKSEGTAARFFHQSDWTAERIEHAAPVHYQAKASRRERDAGLDGIPKRFLATMGDGIGAREHNPKQPTAWVRNPHPTCKPIALAKHLATLLLPPPEYAPRRLLVPFAGSGSEAIGAMLAGWEEIVCIELIQDYCDIAEARLAWWADWLAYTGVDDPKELLRLSNNDKVRKEKEAARLV
jgi:hypothetical protein